MGKVVVTIEGNVEEIYTAMRKFIGVKDQWFTRISWLDDEIEDFFINLQPEAKRILRQIASRPEGYNRDVLVKDLGIDSKGMGGKLSSLGHNLKRDYPMKPSPIEFLEEKREYRMLPEFSKWIKENPELEQI